jgi:hypothetical protein
MIPLSYFLIAWLVLLGLYFLMSMISVMQMVRFGIAGFGTYAATGIYLVIFVLTVLGCSVYFLTVDWTEIVVLFEGLANSPFLNP